MVVSRVTAPGGTSKVNRPLLAINVPPPGPITTWSVTGVVVAVRVGAALGDGETLGVAVSTAAGVPVDGTVGAIGGVGDAVGATGGVMMGVAVGDGDGDGRVAVGEAVSAGVAVRVAVGTIG